MGAMPCRRIASICARSPRRARMPPWIAGCSVLTRPSSISGNWVTEATSSTPSPAAASALAVPPVEINLTPWRTRPWAKGTRPLLSETESSARATGRRSSSAIAILIQARAATIGPHGRTIKRGGASRFRRLALLGLALQRPFHRCPARADMALQHDLPRLAQPAVAEIDALRQVEHGARRLEAEEGAARQLQQHGVAFLRGRGLHVGMKVKADDEAAGFQRRAAGAGQPVLAAQILAVGGQVNLALVAQAEDSLIAVMAAGDVLVAVLLVAALRHVARLGGEMPVRADLRRIGLGDDQRRMRRGRAHRIAPRRIVAVIGAAIDDQSLLAVTQLEGEAHAGSLAFELSHGKERLIVNCGAYDGDDASWRNAMRAAAAHSTLIVAETNSAEIGPDGHFATKPRNVTQSRNEQDGNQYVSCGHDGYERIFGLRHEREIYLSADGEDLRGEDRLTGAGGAALKTGGFVIRFHLHPDVQASTTQEGNAVLLKLPSGTFFRLKAAGAVLNLAESVYLGDGRLRKTRQVVLESHVGSGGASVKWALKREAKKGESPEA